MSPEQRAAKLNEHQERHAHGFYGRGTMGGRYFGAKVIEGALCVTPDFEAWVTVPEGARFVSAYERPVA